MANAARMRADALVYDPQPMGRQQVRTALLDMGFTNVLCASGESEFEKALLRPTWSLIVADAFAGEESTCAMVRAIRSGEIGRNPFVFIILTSWRPESNALHEAINSGADDVILRPFPQGRFMERVRYMMDRERHFVATADYLGPDRRREGQRDDTVAALIPAPNLAEVIEVSASIDDPRRPRVGDSAHRLLLAEQVRWLATQVAMAAHLALKMDALDLSQHHNLGYYARLFRERLRACGATTTATDHADELVRTTRALRMGQVCAPTLLERAAHHAAAAYADFAGDAELGSALDSAEALAEKLVRRAKAGESGLSGLPAGDAAVGPRALGASATIG